MASETLPGAKAGQRSLSRLSDETALAVSTSKSDRKKGMLYVVDTAASGAVLAWARDVIPCEDGDDLVFVGMDDGRLFPNDRVRGPVFAVVQQFDDGESLENLKVNIADLVTEDGEIVPRDRVKLVGTAIV